MRQRGKHGHDPADDRSAGSGPGGETHVGGAVGEAGGTGCGEDEDHGAGPGDPEGGEEPERHTCSYGQQEDLQPYRQPDGSERATECGERDETEADARELRSEPRERFIPQKRRRQRTECGESRDFLMTEEATSDQRDQRGHADTNRDGDSGIGPAHLQRFPPRRGRQRVRQRAARVAKAVMVGVSARSKHPSRIILRR